MASFFNIGRFGRQPKPNTPPSSTNRQPSPGNSLEATTSLQAPAPSHIPGTQTSPSLAPLANPMDQQQMVPQQQLTAASQQPKSNKPAFFFREENATLIVKGNFMTLAAQPEHVERAEWLAHQVVEQYRLLEAMIKTIQEVDQKTGRQVCNPVTCPTMSASEHTYTWLDHNKNPVRIPAAQYISLVQKWILGKINDPKVFPTSTDFTPSPASYPGAAPTPGASSTSGSSAPAPIAAPPTNLNLPLSQLSGRDWSGKQSGFLESFENDVKSIYRQMFRCYAHLYHGHWLDPFYHISAYKELNTCFVHFVNVGKLFGLLADKDTVPMQPLIDIWVAKGLITIPGQSGTDANAAKPVASDGTTTGVQKQPEANKPEIVSAPA